MVVDGLNLQVYPVVGGATGVASPPERSRRHALTLGESRFHAVGRDTPDLSTSGPGHVGTPGSEAGAEFSLPSAEVVPRGLPAPAPGVCR